MFSPVYDTEVQDDGVKNIRKCLTEANYHPKNGKCLKQVCKIYFCKAFLLTNESVSEGTFSVNLIL